MSHGFADLERSMIRIFIAALILNTLLAIPAVAQDREIKALERAISLTGHGEVRAKPDMAVVTVGVMTQAVSARDAVTDNNAAMEKVIAALKTSGIAEKDIQTSNFSVSPRYDYKENSQARLVGYDVSNTVTVTVRDLAGLGTMLDSVVNEGSNQISGIAFDIADRHVLEDQARKLAVADARRKAEIYAAAAGVSLGRVVVMSEFAVTPMPIGPRAMMKTEAAPAVPIAQGEQTVTIDVNMAWEIN
jgi:uncharacterized protein YggE